MAVVSGLKGRFVRLERPPDVVVLDDGVLTLVDVVGAQEIDQVVPKDLYFVFERHVSASLDIASARRPGPPGRNPYTVIGVSVKERCPTCI